jgi:hypothetical protein
MFAKCAAGTRRRVHSARSIGEHRMRILKTLFALLAIACIGRAFAQTGQFDPDAYREYLRTHEGVAASSVLTEFPSPVFDAAMPRGESMPAYFDSVVAKFGLTADEQDILLTQGVMSTERLSTSDFSWGYYDIWEKDLPVLITTDAILHALHTSFDRILRNVEASMIGKLTALLDSLHLVGLPRLHARFGADPRMLPMLRDVDLYLTVARNLLSWGVPQSRYPENRGTTAKLLSLIDGAQPASVALFGETPRELDFSQFTPRGHYADDPTLTRYFKTMIWIGRTEFVLAPPEPDAAGAFPETDVQRQTIDACLLDEALRSDSSIVALRCIDNLLRSFIGEQDNVTVDRLAEFRAALGIARADMLLDDQTFRRWRDALRGQSWSEQRINAQILATDPMGTSPTRPPSVFLLLGQRFMIDSYLLQNVVYDRILDGGVKVPRMLPSPLDALFALGNNAAGQLMAEDIDRYRYGRNLSGLRYLVDTQPAEFWRSSLYNLWLDGIRALNPPENLDGLPAFMRTAGWWQQKMNTQLASWAQLRHDNLLYGKQSFSGGFFCSYPYGYVEPVPAFFRAMAEYGRQGAAHYSNVGLSHVVSYLASFAARMDTLYEIATKELRGAALSSQEEKFIRTFLFARESCVPVLDGWFLKLFYPPEQESQRSCVVADVHTAPTDAQGNPVGWVLHAGTVPNTFGFVIAPSGEGRQSVYIGILLSYVEHVTTNFTRLSDEEWEESMWGGHSWPRPDWTALYLADTLGRKRSPAPSLRAASSELPSSTAAHTAVTISQVYPNPAPIGDAMLIQVAVPRGAEGPLRLSVHDVVGRELAVLVDRAVPKGVYMARWESGAVARGAYFIRCVSATGTAVRKVVVE